jgi:hypothetical protein
LGKEVMLEIRTRLMRARLAGCPRDAMIFIRKGDVNE